MKKTILHILTILVVSTNYGQDILFRKIKTDTTTHYNFVNNTLAYLTLSLKTTREIHFTVLEGETICKPKDSITRIISYPKLLENDPTFKLNEFIELSYGFGKRLNAVEIEPFNYELPFKTGKRYKIMQGFNGKFSHQSVQSKYAKDFKIPIGDTIVAARNGYVVRVLSHFTERGGKSYVDKANQIVIVHDDGTFAYYVHLDTNGTLVKVNDYVKAGQPIGISGFTGYTTKPHLHFVVRNFDAAIPIEFKKQKGIGRKTGVWVKN